MHELTLVTEPEPSPPSPRSAYKRKWAEQKRRSEGAKPVQLAKCGTMAAYRRHLRKSEPVDEACREISRKTKRLSRLRRKKRLETAAAAERHQHAQAS